MLRLNKTQLFCLMMLFEIGSTTLFVLGIDAKQDAWVSILISIPLGLILLNIYLKISKISYKENFAEIIIKVLGKYIGYPLVFFYGLYFIYIFTRNIRDFTELISITFLPDTPFIVINIIFVLCIIYVLTFGLEVLGRTSEINFPILLIFILSAYIFISASGYFNIDQLKPMLSNDIKTILTPVFSQLIFFPFGEIIVFLMFWCYVNPIESVNKISSIAIITSGIILTLTTVITLCVLGPTVASYVTIPFLEVIKLINIADIITNLDAIGIAIIFIGGFYKATIFLYGGVLAFSTLFKLKNYNWLLILICIAVSWYSKVFEPNYSYHVWLGLKMTPIYIHLPFQIIIPVMLLIIKQLKENS